MESRLLIDRSITSIMTLSVMNQRRLWFVSGPGFGADGDGAGQGVRQTNVGRSGGRTQEADAEVTAVRPDAECFLCFF